MAPNYYIGSKETSEKPKKKISDVFRINFLLILIYTLTIAISLGLSNILSQVAKKLPENGSLLFQLGYILLFFVVVALIAWRFDVSVKNVL